jgi:hypothetical protein
VGRDETRGLSTPGVDRNWRVTVGGGRVRVEASGSSDGRARGWAGSCSVGVLSAQLQAGENPRDWIVREGESRGAFSHGP